MKNTSAGRRSQATFRPFLEALETRLTPTTFMVSSLADSGPGSLRAAITSVNADTTVDVIGFSVAGVIQLTSGALPAITNLAKMDGTTAPGFAGAPVVEIDNNGFAGLTITSGADFSTNLVSLSIVNANGPGVTIAKGGAALLGSYIGLALDGSVAANTGAGLLIDISAGATVGGTTAADRNVISGNGGSGIQLNGVATIIGNYIGTDPTGQMAAGNQGDGIMDTSAPSPIELANEIGGTDPGDGNIIAFNSQSGVAVLPNTANPILSNSIFNNGANGIALINNGRPNLPAPQIGYAVESPGSEPGSMQVQIGGVLNVPGQGGFQTICTIQVFATLNGVPPGQGQLFIGSVQATTDANGFAGFTLRNAPVPSDANMTFTATATVVLGNFFIRGNTSVFSTAVGTSTPNQAYVANAYQLLLNRIPDPSSSVWVNNLNDGASPAGVVLSIEASTEYLNDQVSAMYGLYLQRQPDTAGLQYWVSFLQAGGTLEIVAAELTASQEYFVLEGGTNQGFITGLYQEVLRRIPSTGEVAGWETLLDDGVPRLDVSLAFLTSQEYRTNLVQADYMKFLLRTADSGGLTAWVDALNAGATDQQVLAQIFGSAEGYQLWS
jgi:Domain of unknown function (DUF4214)